jgi:hypothetical protein
MSDNNLSTLIAELKELKIRELQVLASLELLVQHTEATSAIRTLPFRVGDAVIITNKIIRPINRPTNKGDRTAVVIKVAPSRIDLRTINGSITWRAPQNLRFRTQDE